MNDSRMREIIHTAMDTCLSGVQPDALVAQRAVNRVNAASGGRRMRPLILAASLALAAAGLGIMAANVFPAWPDSRNATQASGTVSPSRGPSAAAQQAPVAPEEYGWREYLADTEHPPILDALQEILDSTREQVFNVAILDDPQNRSLVFTLLEQYADPYIAIAAIHVSLPEGADGILCSGGAPEDAQIDPIAADSLGVSGELSWLEAAEQLGCPLYRVWADLDATQALFPMHNFTVSSDFAVRYHRDGSLTVFTVAYLYNATEEETISASLYLQAMPMNMGIPAYDDTVRYVSERKEIAFSIEPVSASRSYAYEGDLSMPMSARFAQWEAGEEKYSFEYEDLTLRLTDVRADQTPAGLYVTAEFQAEETIYGRRILDSSRIQVVPVAWSEEYDPLPAGLDISIPADGSGFPSMVFTRMINTAVFPESMIFELLERGPDDNTTILSIPLQLSAEDAAAQAESLPSVAGENR